MLTFDSEYKVKENPYKIEEEDEDVAEERRRVLELITTPDRDSGVR